MGRTRGAVRGEPVRTVERHGALMQFSIRTIASATTAVALMLGFARADFGLFLTVFVVANAVLFFIPAAFLLTTIMFADQRGTYLDFRSNPFHRSLKRLWWFSVVCALTVWLLLFVGTAV